MTSSRREFLRLSAAAAACSVWPGRVRALGSDWDLVREEFLIPEGRIYLNVGTLGAQPRVVVEAVDAHTRAVAETFPPRIDWDALKTRCASLLGGDAAGFVFPRNTTEAMSFVAQGLELEAGDEVLTTDHEHIGGLCPWQLVAARRRLVLRQLPLRFSSDEVLETFRRAIGPRTRVVSVSHVTFTNGFVLPVAELASMCRERGIVFVVDGAHPPGLMPVDIDAIGCDFYASSPHKWLLAPQGTGLLWMAEPWRAKLWPTIGSGGWDDLSLGAHRFNHMGTLDESRLAGLDAALSFHLALGPAAVHARIRQLRRRLIAALAALPRVTIRSPLDDVNGAGMVSFTVDGIESLELQVRLGRENVRTRVISEYDLGWMRLSPHVYVSEAQIDRVVELIVAQA